MPQTDVADRGGVAAPVVRLRSTVVQPRVTPATTPSAGSVAEADEGDWDRCFSSNVKGTFLCSRAAVPHLAAGGGGDRQPGLGRRARRGANFGLLRGQGRRGRAHPLHGHRPRPAGHPGQRDLPRDRVHPADGADAARRGGDLDAGLAATLVKYPIGRLGTPEEIARGAVLLASDDASFVTGPVVTPDGGMTAVAVRRSR